MKYLTLLILLLTSLTFTFFSNRRPNKEELTTNESYCYGIDISKYQGDEVSNLDENKDSLTFIICKATGGITYTDPMFLNNWETIKEKGFIRGAYHFYYTIDDPLDQASNYLSKIKNLNSLDLPPILDFEETSINSSEDIETIQSNLLIFLKELSEKTGRTPIIYTDNNIANKYLTDSVFANYPLWIANYTQNGAPKTPTTWKNKGWTFWQKSSSYTINSINNDFDLFNGNLDDLKQFIKEN